MVQIEKYGNFKSTLKSKKTNVLLCATQRSINDYLLSLKFRYLKQYSRIPHYIITKTGVILQLLDDNDTSFFMQKESIDSKTIYVCLENLGWLEKETYNNGFKDSLGNIYKEVEVFEKKWRDKIYWDKFTEQQIEITLELLKEITSKNNFNKNFVGHNTMVNSIEKFEGIAVKSNYNQKYTDLNPSFNYEHILKNI